MCVQCADIVGAGGSPAQTEGLQNPRESKDMQHQTLDIQDFSLGKDGLGGGGEYTLYTTAVIAPTRVLMEFWMYLIGFHFYLFW